MEGDDVIIFKPNGSSLEAICLWNCLLQEPVVRDYGCEVSLYFCWTPSSKLDLSNWPHARPAKIVHCD